MTILPVVLHGWKEGWRDYFLEEIVAAQNKGEDHDWHYWLIYWAPIINVRIFDLITRTRWTPSLTLKTQSPRIMSRFRLADPPMSREIEFFRAEVQARWDRING